MTSDTPETAQRPHLHPLHVAGSLVALVTVALAQPLLDLLGRNAAFLVAHNTGPLDVLGLGVGLPIVVPLVAAAVVLVLARLHSGLATTVHLVLVGTLGFLLALVVLRLAGWAAQMSAGLVLGVGAGAGVLVALQYLVSAGFRRGLTFVALAAPVVSGIFLFGTPARALVFPGSAADPAPGLSEDSPPVVVAVFDELPVASLLTSSGEIDAEAFPGFARLADESVFFRNASAVHGQTSDAMPAALAGTYPETESLPVAADHPRNLFTLLAGAYDMHVLEPLTELCPPHLCRRPSRAGGEGHYRTLVRDLTVVGSHLVLPPAMTEDLPPLDQGWRDFRAAAAETTKETAVRNRFRELRLRHPATDFERWIDEIAPSDAPTLHFGHVLLPHSPWRYLADGREYDAVPYPAGLDRGRWTDDEWMVAQGYQRHLVQTQLADRLLDRLLDRLHHTGMFDETLLVVMADHGASLAPGTSLRVLYPETFGHIGAVPLFVKPPGPPEPAVSDLPVEVVDVLPTVMDLLDADPPQGIDGRSAFDNSVPPRANKRFYRAGEVLEFDADGLEKWPVVDRKQELFGTDTPLDFPFGLAPEGTEALLGSAAPGSDASPTIGAAVEHLERYRDVNLSATPVPVMVTGVIDAPEKTPVAVAVNGRIMAVTLAGAPEPGGQRFRALVPPDSVVEGENALELFVVGPGNRLQPVDEQPLAVG